MFPADFTAHGKVTTNSAAAHGALMYTINLPGVGGDWILLSERDIRETKARILVDWDGDGTIEADEQDEKRKTDPGLILVKTNTTPVLLGFETLPLGAEFTLHLPEDQSLVKVKIDGAEKTGTQEGLKTSNVVTVESANSGLGQTEITMECGGKRDRLVMLVLNGTGLEIMPAVDYLPVMPRGGDEEETITLGAFLDGEPAEVDWEVTNNDDHDPPLDPPPDPATEVMFKDGTNWVETLCNREKVLLSAGSVASAENGDVAVTISKTDETPKTDTLTIFDLQLSGLRIFDPKLEPIIPWEDCLPAIWPFGDGIPDYWISYTCHGKFWADVTVIAGNGEVAALQRRKRCFDGPNNTFWDGKWGVKQNGTDTPYKGRFADPGKYGVNLKLYSQKNSSTPLSEVSYDLYIVRLGVQKIAFDGDQELAFHKTTPTDTANFNFTDNGDFENDVVWKMESIDFNGSQARKPKSYYGESFEDANNDGEHNYNEKYFDEDSSGGYSTTAQYNFPGQIPTADKDVSGGVDNNNFNRPAVYVKSSHVTAKFKFGGQGKSDVSGDDVNAGYPINDFPIMIRAEYKSEYSDGDMVGVSGQTAASNIRNISPGSGPYTLESEANLSNRVGDYSGKIEFTFWFNNTGESFVDVNGNGVFDDGVDELLNDNDNDGQFDEDWKKIPGYQKTEHRFYCLAAEPTDTALAQGSGRLFMKIVYLTCCWGSFQQTPEEVFEKIWMLDNFWTPFIGTPKHPDNANGFHGVGDPKESSNADAWGNNPMCYTYRHDLQMAQTVDFMLDHNYGRCGGWSKFLPAFAGTHGKNLKPLTLTLLAKRVRGGAVDYKSYVQILAGGNAVGDVIYCKRAFYEVGADLLTGIFVKDSINGQANPAGNVAPNDHLSTVFDNHAVAFNDANDNGILDAGEKIYDGSYEHPGGLSYADVNAIENASIDKYRWYGRFTVTAVDGAGKITGVSLLSPGPYLQDNDPAKTEMEGQP